LDNNGNPRISVIIPTLNEEKLLPGTLTQFTTRIKNLFGIELIVSDGGSIDRTLETAKKYADKVIENPPGIKQKISIGRNEGAKAACGKYFYFFNADTRIEKPEKFFEATLKELSNPLVAALTCNIHVFPEEKVWKDTIYHTFYNLYVRIINPLGMGMGRGECHIIKRDVFFKANGYNENLAAGEDYDLYRRIRKLGKIKFMNDLVVYESPRRYRKYGYLKVFWDWTKNSVSVFFRNKAISEEWEQVR
jgi:glycosyltransferase involved in cell wall biosynthesis